MFAASIRKFFCRRNKTLRACSHVGVRKHRHPSRADCKIRPNLLFMQYSPQIVNLIIFNEIPVETDYNQFNAFCPSGLKGCFQTHIYTSHIIFYVIRKINKNIFYILFRGLFYSRLYSIFTVFCLRTFYITFTASFNVIYIRIFFPLMFFTGRSRSFSP